MSPLQIDRELLLGVEALRQKFVTPDGFLVGLATWLSNPARPLGDVLVELNFLTEDARWLLDLEPPMNSEEISGESLSAEVDGFPVTPSEAVARSPDPEARFGKGAFHDKGGLGQVFHGTDHELCREVAIKEIRDEHADNPDFRSRFLREAMITGGLEHPGIVPVYGLGTNGDGHPYYAMRFIRGKTLEDAIRLYRGEVESGKRQRDFNDLLRRFVDVCNTIAYAHGRGVIHRDLKPLNIMLGPYGETMVVDWGFAKATGKPINPEDGTTAIPRGDGPYQHSQDGDAMGTPSYMSPEQARGEISHIDHRTDIFALGSILCQILTGRPAFVGAKTVEILDKSKKADLADAFQSLSNSGAESELVALAKDCLAAEPTDRVGSASLIASRITASQAAVQEKLRTAELERAEANARAKAERARRKMTFAVAGLGLVLGAVILGFVLVGYGREQMYLKTLKVGNTKLEMANSDAIAAVKKFGEVVANDPTLKNNLALESLRKRLLQEPLAFFRVLRDRLQADPDSRPESLARLAQASFDLGYLTQEIGNKGDALIAFQESLPIRQRLADADPAVTAFQADLAASHNNIGLLLHATGQPAEARKAFDSALGVQQRLVDDNPSVPEFRSRLALYHNAIGHLLSETGKPDEARKACESALAAIQKLADDHPTVTEFQRHLAGSHNNIGVLLRNSGKPADALKAYEAALGIRRKLADDNPAVTAFQSDLAASHNGIGTLLSETGKPAEALKAFEAALAIRRKLADANPTVTAFQGDLAHSRDAIGDVLSATGKQAEGLEAHEAALAIRRKLADDNPTVIAFQSDLAASHNSNGILLTEAGKPAEAMKAYKAALAIKQRLAREHPGSPDLASSLSLTLHNIAEIDLDAKRFEESRDRLRQAAAEQRKAMDANPANPNYRRFLIGHLGGLIKAAQGLGDAEGVADAERERAKLQDTDPAMVALDARLSAIIKGDLQPSDEADRLRLAQRAYDKALYAPATRLWEEAFAANPSLGDDRQNGLRYNAACSAALAGSGRGLRNPKSDEAANAKLRAQAMDWLEVELSSWKKVAMTAEPGNRPLVATMLAHWKADPDLAGVRDAPALEKLSEEERKAWRAFWADADALLKKTGS